jgi:2-oxoglutarate ferredoxin oxidoreductase subunit beta
MTILLFNNRIYGLTKGQYSPTSEIGKITKSTPMGSLDHPFNPLSVVLGAEATFAARTIDANRAQLTEVLTAAAAHRGTSFVEIFQDCPIFNDGAFDVIRKGGDDAKQRIIALKHGEPIRFGIEGEYGVVRTEDGYGLRVAPIAEVGEDAIVVHDETREDPSFAFALSRLSDQDLSHTVTGIFRNVDRVTYDDGARQQVRDAKANQQADLGKLLRGKDTWTVEAE